MPDDIREIKEKLAAIESLLQRLPEIQAVVFLQKLEEFQNARLGGLSAKDLWIVPSPEER